jgi:ATP adenylyltransferase
MKTLWAPWRMTYVHQKKDVGCIFCKKPLEKKDERNLILYRGEETFVVMNRFPYNNGHLMVVPKRHCTDLDELNDREFRELFDVMKVSTQVLERSLSPHGFNIGFNLGPGGGAGLEHLHLHIVPRWMGDTNFMPVLGETKVMPEYLNETYRRLRSAFRDHMGRKKRLERRAKK